MDGTATRHGSRVADRRPSPIDIVVLSHNHYDHLDKPAVKRLAAAHPESRWIVPLGLGAYLRPWGVRDIIELDWWQHLEVEGRSDHGDAGTAFQRPGPAAIGTGRSGAGSRSP